MRWAVLVLALGLVPIRAAGQTRHRPSLDLTIGPATSWGGAHDYSGRLSTSWTLTFVPDNRGSPILAFTIGRRTSDNVGCVLTHPDCAAFPGMTDMGIGVGVQARNAARRVRAILGPMLYTGDLRAGGARLQLDAVRGWPHVQLLLAGRGDLVRRGSENLRLGSLEVGVRVID